MAVIKLTKENYSELIENSSIPVLIDFFATWCGPCRMLSPIIEEVSDEANGKYRVVQVDVDEQPELASRYHITVIPTLVVVKGGKTVNQSTGYIPKEKVLQLLDI